MRYFTLSPVGCETGSAQISAIGEVALLNAVRRIGYSEVAVFEGDDYRFSLGVDPDEEFCVFRREQPQPTKIPMPAKACA